MYYKQEYYLRHAVFVVCVFVLVFLCGFFVVVFVLFFSVFVVFCVVFFVVVVVVANTLISIYSQHIIFVNEKEKKVLM